MKRGATTDMLWLRSLKIMRGQRCRRRRRRGELKSFAQRLRAGARKRSGPEG
jgi:hypothetical protein